MIIIIKLCYYFLFYRLLFRFEVDFRDMPTHMIDALPSSKKDRDFLHDSDSDDDEDEEEEEEEESKKDTVSDDTHSERVEEEEVSFKMYNCIS